MPEKRTIEKARKAKRAGKAATTQAGAFVREEVHKIRRGAHGVRSPQQAVAIGLSKARRAGVNLPPPGRGKAKARTRSATQAQSDADLLDPLYGSGSAEVPELDLDRIRNAQPRPTRERKHTGGARARAVSVQKRSSEVPVLAWLVPMAILAWGVYVFYGSGEIDAGALRAEPVPAAAPASPGGSAPIRMPPAPSRPSVA